MLHSMTGYGKAVGDIGGTPYTIEIRSLNSKNLNLNVDLPSRFKDWEMDLRTWVSKKLSRGKVNLSVHGETGQSSKEYFINEHRLKHHIRELERISRHLDHEPSDIFRMAFNIPDSVTYHIPEPDPEEWSELQEIVGDAFKAFSNFTKKEGKAIEKDLKQRLKNIRNEIKEIEKNDEERKGEVREKLREKLDSLGKEQKPDENRFEEELIYYLEKFDINEEKVRLRTHCDHFEEMMKSKAGQNGKKLNFISQEMGREINTIGSKANHAGIQRKVVTMKDELEKIKEHTMNVL